MLVAMAQINTVVGDVDGNAAEMRVAIERAQAKDTALVVFPELCVCGYPPRDLLLVEGFIAACERSCDALGASFRDGPALAIGCPALEKGVRRNSVIVYQGGERAAVYHKRLLPTYDVFDEDRYFEPGNEPVVVDIGGATIGLAVCEDLWRGEDVGRADIYGGAPDHTAELVTRGAELIVVPSASPYVTGKLDAHHAIMKAHATRLGVPVLSVDSVGGNDDLVFAGRSSLVTARGEIAAQAKSFEEDLLIVDALDATPGDATQPPTERNIVDALTLGVRDYVTKCGFTKVCVGLSGGIDSALVATVAVRALGADNVLGVSMPGRFSSQGSRDDAAALAANLGIAMETVPIDPPFGAFKDVMDPAFASIGQQTLGESLPDLTQENLQSRIRGVIMMALSNRTGALVLTTGNKSEIAVGYCTLYGDMNGGLAVIADLPKTMVFNVSRYINERADELGYPVPPIPENTITKPPSAELAPDQLDSDSLPDYEVLDEIVRRHTEELQSAARIVEETGFDAPTVERICRLIDINEYKRQQMATGLKLTSIAFGRGRRMPIAQRWAR